MSSVMNRLDAYLDILKRKDRRLTDNAIARLSGLGAGVFTNGRKRNSVSYKTVASVCSAFPELSLNWVITGEGDMLMPTGDSKKDEQRRTEQTIISYLENRIRDLELENAKLRNQLQIVCQK